jgi:hydrogenase nickel incorporation protein HypB
MTTIRQLHVQENLLKSNDYLARQLRDRWTAQRTFVVNLLSSPGSGKTTLLEKILPSLMESHRVLVLEGDLETERDAERIRGVGAEAVQITTGGACHLEAHQIQQAWEMLDPQDAPDFVFIENIGNLVCPASYALGAHLRVVLLSVPEGEDKPPKYPKAFRTAQALAITKVDLLPHFEFAVEEAERLAREIQPELTIHRLSAKSGEGLPEWISWLREQRAQAFEA